MESETKTLCMQIVIHEGGNYCEMFGLTLHHLGQELSLQSFEILNGVSVCENRDNFI